MDDQVTATTENEPIVEQSRVQVSEDERLLAQGIYLSHKWQELNGGVASSSIEYNFNREFHPKYLFQQAFLYNIWDSLESLTYTDNRNSEQTFAAAYEWVNNQEIDNHQYIILQIIERYSRYAAQVLGLAEPIFCFDDYRNQGIEFLAVFVRSNNGGLMGILLFDNGELEDKDQNILRFEWWFYKPKAEYLQILQTHLLDYVTIFEGPTATGKTYHKPFSHTPITGDFTKPLIGYHQGALEYSFISMVILFARLHNKNIQQLGLFAQRTVESSQQLSNETVQELISTVVDLPLLTTVLPCWQTLPVVNPLPLLVAEEWRTLEPVINPATQSPIFSKDFICVKATGEIPAFAKEVAIRYAVFLKKLERYDFLTYRESAPPNHDIYFILQRDYSACVGVVIFRPEQTFEKFFQERKNEWQYLTEKYPPPADIPAICQTKYEKNLAKVRQVDPVCRAPDWAKISGVNVPPEYSKHYDKANRYFNLKFFAQVINKVPADGNTHCLTTAWIHPLCQRRGLLEQLWPVFEESYGIFKIDGPSKAMKGFLQKQNINQLEFQRESLIAPRK
jgi:hypothetical protein